MEETYALALQNRLASPRNESKETQSITVTNRLPFTLTVYVLDENGKRGRGGYVAADGSTGWSGVPVKSYCLVTSKLTGAFVTVFQLAGRNEYIVDYASLVDPNDIGPIPQPTKDIWVPQNSPSVVVAFAKIDVPAQTIDKKTYPKTTNYVVREQYWSLLGDSYSLAPGGERTNSFTVVAGRQATSSSQADLSASLGVSASGGWGPVSASLSASLNASASVFQQVTVDEQSTTYVSETVKNKDKDPQLVLRWQIMDNITVYNASMKPISTFASGGVVVVDCHDLGEYSRIAREIANAPPPQLEGPRVPATANDDGPSSFTNNLPIDVNIYLLDSAGRRGAPALVNAGKSIDIKTNGDYEWTAAASGAFIGAGHFNIGGWIFAVGPGNLSKPNEIGPVPQPTGTVIIPADSPSVLVACNQVDIPQRADSEGHTISPTKHYIVREQYWSLMGDSYSITPLHSRTNSFTVVSGRQSTSSSTTSVSTSLGMSASGGWGPVSASLSASLNASASFFQQVTVNEQSTTFVSETVTNKETDPLLILRWQMMDCITVYDAEKRALASVTTGGIVIVQSYKIKKGGLAKHAGTVAALRIRPDTVSIAPRIKSQ